MHVEVEIVVAAVEDTAVAATVEAMEDMEAAHN